MLWKELDYTINKDSQLVIGEVKTSTADDKILRAACKQVDYSEELLKKNYTSITKQIIWIDLNFRNSAEILDEFKEDYHSMKFRKYSFQENVYQYVHLSAQDVFNYGVNNRIINSPELMNPALTETELRHERRTLKQELKEAESALLEIGSVDELDILQRQIGDLKDSIWVLDIKLDISENGRHLIQDKSDSMLKILLNELGANSDFELTKGTNNSNSSGFYSSDKEARYLAISQNDSEGGGVEIDLIDAERVYLRLPMEKGYDLQNVQCISPTTKKTYPLFTKTPVRQFYYSGVFSSKDDEQRESLKEFENVIRKSDPIKVELKPGDVLLVDNHRMLIRVPVESRQVWEVKAVKSE